MKTALRGLLAVLLLAGVAAAIGPQRLLQPLRAVDLPTFVAAVGLAAVAQLASALRWAAIARVLGLAAPTRLFVASYARGITLNVLVPGATIGGDTLRGYALHRHGHPLDAALLSVLLDRLSGLWVLCAVSAAALAAFAAGGRLPPLPLGGGLPVAYGIGLALVLALPWLPWPAPAPRPRADAAQRPPGRLRRLLGRLGGLHALVLARRRPLLRSLWGSTLVQLLSAATLWLCLLAAGGGPAGGSDAALATLAPVLAVAAPIFVAAALPISLGGFGTREVAAALAFPLVGLPADTGVVAAALYGLTAVVIGVLAAPLFAFGPVLPARAAAAGRDPEPPGRRPDPPR